MNDAIAPILRLLEGASIHAVCAYPAQKLPLMTDPLVAVGVLSEQVQLMSYNAGLVQGEVMLDVYASYRLGAQRCRETADKCISLLCGSVADFSVTCIRRGEMKFDAPSDCYRIRICVEMASYYAEQEEI